MNEPDAALAEPDWIRAHPLIRQALELARTAVDFTARPAAFTGGWLAGTREATNPLSMVALSLAAVTSLRAALGVSAAAASAPSGLWKTLALTALPYLHYALVGALLHVFSGGFRADRPRLRTTVALMLFTAGGPVTMARLFEDGFGVLARTYGVPFAAGDAAGAELESPRGTFINFGVPLDQFPVLGSVLVAAAAGMMILIVRALVLSVATAHRLRAWKVLAAVIAAFLVAGTLYGMAGLPSVPGIFQPFRIQVRWRG